MKCIKCNQMFLKDVKNLSKTKKSILPKTCPGCRIMPGNRSFKENKK
ncbi:MAG TPA: hypothetical protein VIH31_00090 [Candidatus Paceibacterota bacterium]